MGMRSTTVDATTRGLLAWNERRTAWSIFNGGANTVYISQDAANVDRDGVPLAPGAALEASLYDGDEPQLAVYAVAPGGATPVRIIEQFGEVIARVRV